MPERPPAVAWGGTSCFVSDPGEVALERKGEIRSDLRNKGLKTNRNRKGGGATRRGEGNSKKDPTFARGSLEEVQIKSSLWNPTPIGFGNGHVGMPTREKCGGGSRLEGDTSRHQPVPYKGKNISRRGRTCESKKFEEHATTRLMIKELGRSSQGGTLLTS